MIELTLGQLIDMVPVLQQISKVPLSSGLMLYKFGKIINKVNEEVDLYNTTKQKMMDTYVGKDENGQFLRDENGNLLVKVELQEQLNKQLNDLVEIKETLDIDKFSISDFDNLGLNSQQILPLLPLIE